MTTTDTIFLTALNLFWGWVWFEVGKFMGRKEKENEKENQKNG